MKKLICLCLLLVSVVGAWSQSPKYVFLFIGDGMGYEHLKLATEELSFANFPVKGELMTHSADKDITDSAAAGTALATGHKTSNGTIGMDSARKVDFSSIAIEAKRQGWAAGVVTTVSIDHATPAAFYAHVPSRNMYHEISGFVPTADLDFYGGAGFKNIGRNFKKFKKAGYTILRGKDAKMRGDKIVYIQEKRKNVSQLPYAVDRKDDDMTLEDLVEGAIEFMLPKGKFFLMAEGGMIDWAAHNNDAYRAAGEVDDLSEAVEEALDFYEKHPDETLIVITADHETGGLYFDENGEAKWTTDYHTAANVPLFAIGIGAEKFGKTMENNEMSNILRELIK